MKFRCKSGLQREPRMLFFGNSEIEGSMDYPIKPLMWNQLWGWRSNCFSVSTAPQVFQARVRCHILTDKFSNSHQVVFILEKKVSVVTQRRKLPWHLIAVVFLGRNVSCDFAVGFSVCYSCLLGRYLLSQSKLSLIFSYTQNEMFYGIKAPWQDACDFIKNQSIVLTKNCWTLTTGLCGK